MATYYFDLRDGEELFAAQEGLELRNMSAAQKEAGRALGGLAGEAAGSFDGEQRYRMAIEVRDCDVEVEFLFLIIRRM